MQNSIILRNHINTILLCCLIFSTFSCKSRYDITFSEPQPIKAKKLKKIPKSLHGDFIYQQDSSISLFVDDKIITQTYKLKYEKLASDLDSISSKMTSSIYVLIDTLFYLDENNIVKKMDNTYLLNSKISNSQWNVTKVEIEDKDIIISRINEYEDLDYLKKITGIKNDSLYTYNFSISRKQFKEFLNKGGFKSKIKYTRI